MSRTAPMPSAEGTGGPSRRRRTPLEMLSDAPKDWVLERCAIPAEVLGYAITFGGPLLLGMTPGAALGLNYWVSKFPPFVNLIRAVRGRDTTFWTRPQARQAGLSEEVKTPIELRPGVKGVPKWVARLARTAESGTWLTRPLAKFGDDWVNERARTPGFVISLGVVAAGLTVAAIPAIVLFPLTLALGFLPKALAGWLWLRNGRARDFEFRFTRPGMFQRPSTIEHLRRLEVERLERAPAGAPRRTLPQRPDTERASSPSPEPSLRGTPVRDLSAPREPRLAGHLRRSPTATVVRCPALLRQPLGQTVADRARSAPSFEVAL